ncbi:Lysyl oxidase-like 3B [Holothuria leucospilota]|uniref:Lysyl oxidase-like 3B n=1 Tax=Holothuria leucospilota TaxID=206669 RepID=A0A9Q1BW88_HOLLE|nr:Lysyl oxidase-like 3B [Holothuria leucospilota]
MGKLNGAGLLMILSFWGLLSQGHGQHVGDVRLVGGSVPHEGRMELYLGVRGWFATCDKNWNILDAIVICRQLGFPGAAFAIRESEFERPMDSRLLSRTWICTGVERRLGQCRYEPTYMCNDAVGVICQGPSYLGCYSDDFGIFHSLLQEAYFVSSSLTVEGCKKFCEDSQHPIVGLKNGQECYCGDSRDVILGHEKYTDDMCQQRCSGDQRQVCGGSRTDDHDSISIFDVHLGECQDPGIPLNGIRLNDWFKFGDEVGFNCIPGYKLVGAGVIQCILTKQSGGHEVHWNDSSPICVEPSKSPPTSTVTSSESSIKPTTTVTSKKTTLKETTLYVPETTSSSTPRSTTVTTSRTIVTLSAGTTPTIHAPSSRFMTTFHPSVTTTDYKSTQVKVLASSTADIRDAAETDTMFYTELIEGQTELLPENHQPEVPNKNFLGLSEDVFLFVCIGGVFVALLVPVLILAAFKRLICSRRR